MKLFEKNYKRIVIKVGGSILRSASKQLDLKLISDIVAQVDLLVKEKKEVVLVSSGAILLGMAALGLENKPTKLSYLQAVAAVGQNELMNVYRGFFSKKNLICAQVLLTWEDFSGRARYLNAKNTLTTLFKLGSIPVINENDTVATDEIKFGDNDRLSALVSSMIAADLLIILSDVDGLLDKDRKVIHLVDKITSQIKEVACPSDKKVCAGGMITKIEAARIAMDSGIPCVIANGRKQNIIMSIIDQPQKSGTLFLPNKGLTAKKRWLAFGTRPKGKIIVDEGARDALLNKKSLLCVGVVSAEGTFQENDVVSVRDKRGNEFARGKISVSHKQLEKVKGSRFHKEIIHLDNIVIF